MIDHNDATAKDTDTSQPITLYILIALATAIAVNFAIGLIFDLTPKEAALNVVESFMNCFKDFTRAVVFGIGGGVGLCIAVGFIKSKAGE